MPSSATPTIEKANGRPSIAPPFTRIPKFIA
jgi:hypothetical protein